MPRLGNNQQSVASTGLMFIVLLLAALLFLEYIGSIDMIPGIGAY